MRDHKEYSDTIPIQYAEGSTRFLDMEIKVDPRVLIPRPETELLVEVVVRFLRERSWADPFILDVGTGSGIIPLGIVRSIPDARVVAADISSDALEVARENIRTFEAEEKVELVISDMFSGVCVSRGRLFDCIVSNPPYVSGKDFDKLDAWVRAEPKEALYAGEEGMDHLNIIAEESGKFLAPGGFVAVEVGYDQAPKVKDRFHECGFRDIVSFKDLNDHERVVIGWKHG